MYIHAKIYVYIYIYTFTFTILYDYTGVDTKQEFCNKKEEQQASIGARDSRTGDPGTGDPLEKPQITGRDH